MIKTLKFPFPNGVMAIDLETCGQNGFFQFSMKSYFFFGKSSIKGGSGFFILNGLKPQTKIKRYT